MVTPIKPIDTQASSVLDLARPKFDLDDTAPIKDRMQEFIFKLQKSLVGNLEKLDNNPKKKFLWDRWEREDKRGYGISCVIQDSLVLEKAGVNITIMDGPLSSHMRASMKERKIDSVTDDGDYDFRVAGISVVIHPSNPMAPTAHFNYRYFQITERDKPEDVVASWFGGGADLTPYYIFEEDCKHFHKTHRDVCDKHDPELYPKFKKNCDKYFYLPHRKEVRGIGGIIFDDLMGEDPKKLFTFATDCGFAFQEAYLPILEKRKDMPFTKEQKEWQQVRRGRYVEFNVMIDRGTKFGLATENARIESILMTLPLTARWEYMHVPKPGSEEEKLVNILRDPIDWA
ncbi:Oxygen-dependent coproporphyrinogen-III oxidase, mitochondrial [Zancudomyces culisetae]|uniref:coproporphyrinogen oxidase n=1 Tax=Zancudomyces culisetae TaxID=1213189 RepID=A0A1R1PMR2_ZANCU|nr:Oxygen-dependent coproporphyrinogen-III oxidase, mitochondrial [Zancudomyces culisetae]|eukprot:OMH82237.1 Oxygen-dependent coproporphyrinogen-III oxidase, mitochondrial [Zancudomyces culisetae]